MRHSPVTRLRHFRTGPAPLKSQSIFIVRPFHGFVSVADGRRRNLGCEQILVALSSCKVTGGLPVPELGIRTARIRVTRELVRAHAA